MIEYSAGISGNCSYYYDTTGGMESKEAKQKFGLFIKEETENAAFFVENHGGCFQNANPPLLKT